MRIIFPGMFLIFLTLKLCGVIAWSWWLVTAPLWGPLIVWFLLIMLAFVCVIKESKADRLRRIMRNHRYRF